MAIQKWVLSDGTIVVSPNLVNGKTAFAERLRTRLYLALRGALTITVGVAPGTMVKMRRGNTRHMDSFLRLEATRAGLTIDSAPKVSYPAASGTPEGTVH